MTECNKCGKEMPPIPKATGRFANVVFTPTGFRCECGHWNDLKKRKWFKEQSVSAKK